MFCGKCGVKLSEDAQFCGNCGEKVTLRFEKTQTVSTESAPMESVPMDHVSVNADDGKEETSKSMDILAWIIVGVVAIIAVVAIFAAIGFIFDNIISILIIIFLGGTIIAFALGDKKEKFQTIKYFVIGLILLGIVYVVNFRPDIIDNALTPGAVVRTGYLSSYSDTTNVETAFERFFGNEKWSTFEEDGYEYVIFNGTCFYSEEQIDVRFKFKITGENFVIDSMDINGEEQSDLIIFTLLEKIYEDEDE